MTNTVQHAQSTDSSTQLNSANLVIDIEQEFLNHLHKQDSLEHILREGVSNDLLNSPTSKSVYQFAERHFSESQKAPTIDVLHTEFRNADFEEPSTEVHWVVEKLRTRYKKNKIENLAYAVAKKLETPDEAMDILRDEVMEIERQTLSQAEVFRPGDHKEFLKDLQEDILQGMYKGVSYGHLPLDQFTGGLKKGQVCYWLARPKRQKSFNVLAGFIEQVKNGEEPYLFTLELTRQEILQRISCMISGIPWDKMQRGALMSSDYGQIEQAWEDFNKWGKYYIEMPPLDERTVPALMLKADKVDAGPIHISQFKYINGTKDWYPNDFTMHAEVAIDLKRAAIRPGKERPIIIEAQFNRGGDSMEELEDFDAGKVGLTDMIPQSADMLLGIFQSKEMRASNQIEVGILDSRNTGKSAWYCQYEYINYTELKMLKDSQH